MMAKQPTFANPAFQKKTENPAQFNVVAATTALDSLKQIKELDKREITRIEKIIVDHFIPNQRTDEEAEHDTKFIARITAEIKSIGRQALLLTGERIAKVQEALKYYRGGAFGKWLEMTFGSARTGYNALAYFNFFTSLPELDLQEKFKKLPQKAAYMLAARNGDLEKKIEIVREYHDVKNSEEVILLIQEKLPPLLDDVRRRTSHHTKLIGAIVENLKKVHRKKESLSAEEKKELLIVSDIIRDILTPSTQKSENVETQK